MGDLSSRQSTPAAYCNEVQANGQTRILMGKVDCFIEAGAGYHQAGAGEKAMPMRRDYGFIDSRGKAKVITVNYNQATLARCSLG
jgi:hypothetical protein